MSGWEESLNPPFSALYVGALIGTARGSMAKVVRRQQNVDRNLSNDPNSLGFNLEAVIDQQIRAEATRRAEEVKYKEKAKTKEREFRRRYNKEKGPWFNEGRLNVLERLVRELEECNLTPVMPDELLVKINERTYFPWPTSTFNKYLRESIRLGRVSGSSVVLKTKSGRLASRQVELSKSIYSLYLEGKKFKSRRELLEFCGLDSKRYGILKLALARVEECYPEIDLSTLFEVREIKAEKESKVHSQSVKEAIVVNRVSIPQRVLSLYREGRLPKTVPAICDVLLGEGLNVSDNYVNNIIYKLRDQGLIPQNTLRRGRPGVMSDFFDKQRERAELIKQSNLL